MPLFPKKVVHFGFFTNEMEGERGKQDFGNKIVILSIPISTQKCQEKEFQKILYN